MEWNVHVYRDGNAIQIGQVTEACELSARQAALSKFAITEDEVEAGEIRPKGSNIYPGEGFDVTLVDSAPTTQR